MLSVPNQIIRHTSSFIVRSMLPVCQVRRNVHTDENQGEKSLKELSNKARVIALKVNREAKKRDWKKLLKVGEKKKTYEVHQHMSVTDICMLTGAPIDILLDQVLSHVCIFLLIL